MRVIDMHCDTIWQLFENQTQNLKKNTFAVDVKRLREADSMAQFFACFIYMSEFTGADRYTKGYEKALDMIALGKKAFADCEDDIVQVRDFKGMMRATEGEKISAFLTVEEGGILENHMERLEHLYKEGICLMTLLWNEENCIGFPNSRDANIMQKGLKSFGIEVVQRMNELGMIIDVSHLSDGGFWDVLKHSTVPVVASHSNVRRLCSHPRNLSDEMIRALAKQGGIAGINLYPYFICKSGRATAEDIADHVIHMWKKGGEDFVAIGTDFDGFDEGETEICHPGQLSILYDVLHRRGFTERQLEKIMYGNAMRVIKCLL